MRLAKRLWRVWCRVRIRPLFAWYDLWVGLFVDTHKKRLYILPVPCLGLVVELKEDPWTSDDR